MQLYTQFHLHAFGFVKHLKSTCHIQWKMPARPERQWIEIRAIDQGTRCPPGLRHCLSLTCSPRWQFLIVGLSSMLLLSVKVLYISALENFKPFIYLDRECPFIFLWKHLLRYH